VEYLTLLCNKTHLFSEVAHLLFTIHASQAVSSSRKVIIGDGQFSFSVRC